MSQLLAAMRRSRLRRAPTRSSATTCTPAFAVPLLQADNLLSNRMYTGNEGIYTYTFEHQKKPECPVCGGEAIAITRPAVSTLQDLIDYLLEKQDLYVHVLPRTRVSLIEVESSQVRRPSFSLDGKNLYLQNPPQLELATRPNLEKTLAELFISGEILSVTDAGLPFSLSLQITFE